MSDLYGGDQNNKDRTIGNPVVISYGREGTQQFLGVKVLHTVGFESEFCMCKNVAGEFMSYEFRLLVVLVQMLLVVF